MIKIRSTPQTCEAIISERTPSVRSKVMVPPKLQNLNRNMHARQSGQALASRKLLPQKVSMHLSAQIDQTMILQPSGDKSGKPWQNQIR